MVDTIVCFSLYLPGLGRLWVLESHPISINRRLLGFGLTRFLTRFRLLHVLFLDTFPTVNFAVGCTIMGRCKAFTIVFKHIYILLYFIVILVVIQSDKWLIGCLKCSKIYTTYYLILFKSKNN